MNLDNNFPRRRPYNLDELYPEEQIKIAKPLGWITTISLLIIGMCIGSYVCIALYLFFVVKCQ